MTLREIENEKLNIENEGGASRTPPGFFNFQFSIFNFGSQASRRRA